MNHITTIAALSLFTATALPAIAAPANLSQYDGDAADSVIVNMDVTETSEAMTFTFDYEGPGTLTNVYFERGLLGLLENGLNNRTWDTTGDAKYNERSLMPASYRPSNRPANDAIIGWTGTFFSMSARGATPGELVVKGLNDSTDSLSISINKLDGVNVDDLLSQIGDSGFRVAALVQGLTEDNGEGAAAALTTEDGGAFAAFVTTGGAGAAVPTPAAVIPGLILLGGMASRRRRQA